MSVLALAKAGKVIALAKNTAPSPGDPPSVTLVWPRPATHVGSDWDADGDESYVVRHYAHQEATLRATATAPDGDTISRVEFWLDGTGSGTKVGEITTPEEGEYRLAWDCWGVADGSHTITARAVTNTTAVGDSLEHPLMVWNGPEQIPTPTGMTPEPDMVILSASGTTSNDGTPVDVSDLISFDSGTLTYTLLRDAVFPGVAFVVRAAGITLDLNDHTVWFNADGLPGHTDAGWNAGSPARCAVFLARGLETTIGTFLGITESGYPQANNATIRNGTIVQAVRDLQGQTALFGRSPSNATITGLKVFVSGKDSLALRLWGGTATVRDCRLLAFTTSVTNRQAIPSCLNIGEIDVADSVILGGNAGLAFSNGVSGAAAQRNVISQLSSHANGYGVATYRNVDSVVRDNVVIPINGRGTLFNGGGTVPSESSGNAYEDNIFLSWEHPNREFNVNLSGTSIRMRYEMSGIAVRNNSCLAIGGDRVNGHLRTGGLSYYDTVRDPGSIEVSGNIFRALYAGDGSYDSSIGVDRRAEAASFQGTESAAEVAFTSNTLASNLFPLALAGTDGGGQLAGASTFDQNTMAFMAGESLVDGFIADLDAKLAGIEMDADPWAAWARNLVVGELQQQPRATALHPDRRTGRSGWTEAASSIDVLRPAFSGGAALDAPEDWQVIRAINTGTIAVGVDADGSGTIGAGDHRLTRAGEANAPVVREEVS